MKKEPRIILVCKGCGNGNAKVVYYDVKTKKHECDRCQVVEYDDDDEEDTGVYAW